LGSVAKLPVDVEAPAPHAVVAAQRTRMLLAGCDRDHVVEHVPRHRGAGPADPELALLVVAPAPRRRIGEPGARVQPTGGDRGRRTERGDRDRRELILAAAEADLSA